MWRRRDSLSCFYKTAVAIIVIVVRCQALLKEFAHCKLVLGVLSRGLVVLNLAFEFSCSFYHEVDISKPTKILFFFLLLA